VGLGGFFRKNSINIAFLPRKRLQCKRFFVNSPNNWKSMKTEQVKLSQVKTNKFNPRTITGDKFNKLINSILVLPKMLELRPIVVDNTNVSLGGNMRYRGLTFIASLSIGEIKERLSGLREFDKKTTAEQNALFDFWEKWLDSPTAHIIKASDLSEEEQKAFIIKDNVGYGEWDHDMLANEWDAEDLDDWGVDVWQDKDIEIGDFFNSAESDKPQKTEKVICPHCGKDINKSKQEYEYDSDN
jgi:hypothetical protein